MEYGQARLNNVAWAKATNSAGDAVPMAVWVGMSNEHEINV